MKTIFYVTPARLADRSPEGHSFIAKQNISFWSLPTSLLKKYSHILSPILSKLVNLSFSTGIFPSIFKSVQVLPY